MFQGFDRRSKAERQLKIDPEPGPLAEAFNNRGSNFHLKQPQIISREESGKQAENSQRQVTSAASAAAYSQNNKDLNGNNTSTPLSVPSNTTTRGDDSVSDPFGSQFGSSSLANDMFKKTAAPQGFGGGFGGPPIMPEEIAAANKARSSPSTESGVVTAFSSVSLAGGATATKIGTENGFTGFGGKSAPESEFSSTTATPVKPRPAINKWSDIPKKTMMDSAPTPIFAPIKKDLESGLGFAGFGTRSTAVPSDPPMTKTAPAPVDPPGMRKSDSDRPSFGTFSSAMSPAAPAPMKYEGGGGFTGFGDMKSTVAPAPVSTPSAAHKPTPANPFAGFGTFQPLPAVFVPLSTKQEDIVPAQTRGGGFGPNVGSTLNDRISLESAERDFGSLHVSGPLQTMKEEEEVVGRKEKAAAHAVAAAAAAANDVPQPREEEEEAPENADDSHDTDTDDEGEPEHRYPWGARTSLKILLDGGRKKLVLVQPTERRVSDYFIGKVYRSYGCTYDHLTTTFYATSPGSKGARRGQVVALDGGVTKPPVVLANNLDEPAAIAVYEAGVSVCTVTNRGIFVLTKQGDVWLSRQISNKPYHRGIAATAGGGIVSFSNGIIRMFDGNVDNGQERVLAEANYDTAINDALFMELPNRRFTRSNCCFMDIVHNILVLSDLQKHVISLWDIEETEKGRAIHFTRAIDVGINANPGRGPAGAAQIPLGKCSFVSGIRLDKEGWVLCADAEGRTLQIFDDKLNFVTRLESAERLPYISGLFLESDGHLMVCDRKSEMGGLRVYLLEAVDKAAPEKTLGLAATSRQQPGSRF